MTDRNALFDTDMGDGLQQYAGGLSAALQRYLAQARPQAPWEAEPWRYPESVKNGPARPSDAMAPVSEAISPTMGAYGMGEAFGSAVNALGSKDWGRAVEPSMMLAAALIGPKVGKGDRPVSARNALSDATESPGFTLSHVSPHNFDRFDKSKIGTGFGHTDEGHGFYFTSPGEFIDSYAKELAQKHGSANYYDVRINADKNKFLNWDDLPRDMQEAFRTEKGAAAAVQVGVPGVRVPGGKWGDSYVVFDDKIIDILRKYGIAGTAVAGGGMAFDRNDVEALGLNRNALLD